MMRINDHSFQPELAEIIHVTQQLYGRDISVFDKSFLIQFIHNRFLTSEAEYSIVAMGIKQAKKIKPDLVLLDISLPVKSGFQVLDEIKKDETLSDVAIIALTASAMPDERESILSHGFDGYISKPIDAELLEDTIREALYGN
jgi:CheY-like chemotaxis protein